MSQCTISAHTNNLQDHI